MLLLLSPSGGSTLMISAPRSPRSWVQNGPERNVVRSSTRTPANKSTQSAPFEDVDGAGPVVQAGDPSAGHMGEAHAGTGHLAGAGSFGELPEHLDGLGRAARADGVALRQEPAAGIDHSASAVGRRTRLQHGGRLPRRAELEGLVV